jgi:hypothetical protein
MCNSIVLSALNKHTGQYGVSNSSNCAGNTSKLQLRAYFHSDSILNCHKCGHIIHCIKFIINMDERGEWDGEINN